MGRIANKSLMVVCGDEFVVAAACNVAIMDDVAAAVDVAATTIVDVAATDGVVVAVGVVVAIVVWVQWCWMRACTSPQYLLVSVVVTPRGKEPSWWFQQTTQGPHSTMGRLVCCQPWC